MVDAVREPRGRLDRADAYRLFVERRLDLTALLWTSGMMLLTCLGLKTLGLLQVEG